MKPSFFSGRFRWVICALLFFATTINYIDRQILSLIKEVLDVKIGWTNTEFGLVNSAFQLAYAFGGMAFGWLIDRFGTKTGYAISILAWSLAAISHSFAATLTGFMIARVALGLGEGGNFPSAIKATALWFPRKERALATSIFNSGSNVGAIVAPMLVPLIVGIWGWQAAFVAAGIAGILWLAFWLPLYNTPEKSPHLTEAERLHVQGETSGAVEQPLPWLSLLRYRQTWAFVVAKCLTDPIWWFLLIWLPSYFKSTRGLDIKKGWMYIAAIYGIITVLSIAGGWLTGRFASLGWSITRARKTSMFLFACLVLPIFFVTQVGDWSAVLIIALAGACHQAWSANLFTTVSDMFPKQAVASVVGIGGLAGGLSGALAPTVTGWVLDHSQSPTAGYAILFSISAFAYLVAFGLNHWLAPKFEQINPTVLFEIVPESLPKSSKKRLR